MKTGQDRQETGYLIDQGLEFQPFLILLFSESRIFSHILNRGL